jgi:CSLREA domain-containing protein
VCGALVFATPPHAQASFPGQNGVIAFVGDCTRTTGGLCVVNADGSAPRQIDSASTIGPAWSPDGTRIAYPVAQSGSGALNQLDIYNFTDGKQEPPITAIHSPVSWSPDGKRLAFDNNGVAAIYDLATGKVTSLGGCGRPKWSPDGTRILAVCRDPDGTNIPDLGIFTRQQNGTFSFTGVLMSGGQRLRGFDPDWSPDSTKIVFQQPYDPATAEQPLGIVSATGGPITRLELPPASGCTQFIYQPAWSPDGQRIVFYDAISGGDCGSASGLFVTAPSGGSVQRITYNYQTDPAWQPIATIGLSLEVNSTADTGDKNPGDGKCNTGTTLAGGVDECTLRAAIEEANAQSKASTITFDLPGSGIETIAPAAALPAVTTPVTIDATTQPGYSSASGKPLIELNGSPAGLSIGLQVSAPDTTIAGLAIYGFKSYGIRVSAPRAVIRSDFIGTDASGTMAPRQGGFGVLVLGPGATIRGNLISGYTNQVSDNIDVTDAGGISIDTTGTVVQGNLIGTNVDGTAALGNWRGILVDVHASATTIGGTTPAARNTIASGKNTQGLGANAGGIVILGSHNVVEGNYIGTDRGAVTKLGMDMVQVEGTNNTIGGLTPGAGNVIAGQVELRSNGTAHSRVNRVLGNLIGTQKDGQHRLLDGGFGTTGGGVALVGANDNLISSNTVAFSRNFGVAVEQSEDNKIFTNKIFENVGTGVDVTGDGSSGDSIRKNSIHDNGRLGIDLGGDGVTKNDQGDSDKGPNSLQNYPDKLRVTQTAGGIQVTGFLSEPTSQAGRTYTIDLYSNPTCDPSGFGEGERFLGTLEEKAQAAGTVAIRATLKATVPSGQPFVTATATDPNGNTSEFSSCEKVATGQRLGSRSPTPTAGRTVGGTRTSSPSGPS